MAMACTAKFGKIAYPKYSRVPSENVLIDYNLSNAMASFSRLLEGVFPLA